jgi:hypothetical protein
VNSQFSPNFWCLMVVKAEKDQGHVPAKLFLYIDSMETWNVSPCFERWEWCRWVGHFPLER